MPSSPRFLPMYSAVLAIIGVATLVFETGAYSGLTRYFHEASQHGARGTFYRNMQVGWCDRRAALRPVCS